MAARNTGAKSLKDYLKKYESNNVEEKKKKKKKKTIPEANGVLVVDEDPIWQKPVNLEEEDEDDLVEEKPLVDEDIEVKRMRRLEQIRARRAYNSIAEDGSGWVSLSSTPADANNTTSDISPPRRQRARNDSPSPEPGLRPSFSSKENTDLSPPRQKKRHHTPSPEPDGEVVERIGLESDLSPPRKRVVGNDSPETQPEPPRRQRYHSPSPEPEDKPPKTRNVDLSPLRRKRYRSPSHESEDKPPRMRNYDLSPPRRRRYHSPSPESGTKPSNTISLSVDLSPPRRKRDMIVSPDSDLSPPRKSKEDSQPSRRNAPRNSVSDLSPPRRSRKESPPPSTMKEQRKTGLISGHDIRDEIWKTKKDELSRFKEMNTMLTGKGAEPVFRDKKGERISKEEYIKSKQKVEEKPKEIKLEWGKGLAQKREAETKLQELEAEKSKPFARTRDDADLDKMLKERVRWGDPMAHLVKKKQYETVVPDLGDNERMKESGFIIPQTIPNHSWIKRGLDAAPNRYGIKPGRHWDGVDRSNGYEKQLFQRTNEKRATEREAYLWSVSDM